MNVYIRVLGPGTWGQARKRCHQKDKGRKKRRRWRHTHSGSSPSPSLPSLSRRLHSAWAWQNLAQEPEDGRLSWSMHSLLDPTLKSKGTGTPSVTLQSPGLRMDNVSISRVLLLSACLSLRDSVNIFATIPLVPIPPPQVKESVPLKQRPPAGLLSRLAANRGAVGGGGSSLPIGCPAPRPYRDPGSCPAASVLIPPPPTGREQR